MQVVTAEVGNGSVPPVWWTLKPDSLSTAPVVLAILALPSADGDERTIAAAVAEAISAAIAHASRPAHEPVAAASLSRRTLSNIRQWMVENLAEPMTLDDLATRAHLSRRQFTRDFRAETGTSPGRWLLRERLRRATQLLEDSDLPVERIAATSGFPSSAAFRTHFKRHTGQTPSSHRARRRRAAAAGDRLAA